MTTMNTNNYPTARTDQHRAEQPKMPRGSGILMHITSLPSPYGIGTMGQAAYDFVKFLKAAGQRYWQILPLGTTGYGDSPYQNFSIHAGNPYLIDLDLLVKDGLLAESAPAQLNFGTDPAVVDYGAIYQNRRKILGWAYDTYLFLKRDEWLEGVDRFRQQQAYWLEDYALFMTLKQKLSGDNWFAWPEEYRLRKPEALAAFYAKHEYEIEYYIFEQYLFFRQWQELRHFANDNNIQIIGDLPIYVAEDSVDFWAEPKLFQVDEQLVPTFVAGCPPDAFTLDGQLWGNPLYDWEKMAETDYAWWVNRMRWALQLYDYVRIDHFRGLESYWAIPHGDPTAKRGLWCEGPADDLFDALRSQLGSVPVIAEDLGFLNAEVLAFRDRQGYPGMNILQFAFDSELKSNYLPHNLKEYSLIYTGTHDNHTVLGWFEEADPASCELASQYFNLTREEGYNWGMIRGAMTSIARIAIFQMQDFLGLGADARMNRPGQAGNNWHWRMYPGAASVELAKKIYQLTRLGGRLPEAEPSEAMDELKPAEETRTPLTAVMEDAAPDALGPEAADSVSDKTAPSGFSEH